MRFAVYKRSKDDSNISIEVVHVVVRKEGMKGAITPVMTSGEGTATEAVTVATHTRSLLVATERQNMTLVAVACIEIGIEIDHFLVHMVLGALVVPLIVIDVITEVDMEIVDGLVVLKEVTEKVMIVKAMAVDPLLCMVQGHRDAQIVPDLEIGMDTDYRCVIMYLLYVMNSYSTL